MGNDDIEMKKKNGASARSPKSPKSKKSAASAEAFRKIEIENGSFKYDPNDVPPGGLFGGAVSERSRLFVGNAIKSTKYEVWSFVFQNLGEQLAPWMKPANFYFLCIAVLQAIPSISTTGGIPTIMMPLSFVLVIAMLKDWFEDKKRRVMDNKENNAEYPVYRKGKWVEVASKNLMVGDFIKIVDDARIPADVFCVAAGSDNGEVVFVDTKDLDGETNLKPKIVPGLILEMERGDPCLQSLEKIKFTLKCDHPGSAMDEWVGKLLVEGQDEVTWLSLDNFLLRSCTIRNTPWMIGLVIYTGEETKIRMNNAANKGNIKYKTTQVFRQITEYLKAMFLLQVFICFIFGILAGVEHKTLKSDDWYLALEDSAAAAGVLRFCTWFIICKDFLPISLYVSLEMVQFLQAMFIGYDAFMAYRCGDEWQMGAVQTSRLNEELNQIEYIFSDKTGTLTQNRMDFKKLVVGKSTYGTGSTAAGVVAKCREMGGDIRKMIKEFEERNAAMKVHPFVEFDEQKRLFSEIEQGKKQCYLIKEYFYALSLNNTVFPKLTKKAKKLFDAKQLDLNDVNAKVDLQLDSSSPDEKALVYMAQYMGFEIFKREEGKIKLKRTDPDGTKYFELFEDIELIDFTSKRKRMTVIVSPLQGPDKGKLKIYCKGADSYVCALLRGSKKSVAEMERLQTSKKYSYEQLADFGKESLRTLVVAVGTKPRSWWDGPSGWSKKYTQAKIDYRNDEKKLSLMEETIERDAEMDLIGCTAIEDKLQDGVQSCIRNLLDADIKIWVLTGDNVSTAINIGISCNLLEADMAKEKRLFVFDNFEKEINTCSAEQVTADPRSAKLKSFLEEKRSQELVSASKSPVLTEDDHDKIANLCKGAVIHQRKVALLRKRFAKTNGEMKQRREDYGEDIPLGMALHGNVWKVLAREEELDKMIAKGDEEARVYTGGEDRSKMEPLRRVFHALGSQCKSVLGCRLEPKEKADIVRLVQEIEGVSTLAIGDGNNDTVMIKTAEIGVGIRGVEGTSAVSAADYVISQFSFLQRMLLVYGRLNNRRISFLVMYIFYKTSMVVWTVVFFGFHSAFSGQFPYLDWMFQLHNIAYTGVPIIVFAVLDQDLSMKELQAHPFVFPWSRGTSLFGPPVFIEWVITSFIHGTICFMIPWYAFDTTSPSSDGQSYGFQASMMCVYMCSIIVCTGKICWYAKTWSWLWQLSIYGSVVSFFLALAVFNSSSAMAIGGIDYYGLVTNTFALGRFWLVVLLTTGLCMTYDFVRAVVPAVFFPTETRVMEEAMKLGMTVDEVLFQPVKKINPRAALEPEEEKQERKDAYTGFNFSHTASHKAWFRSGSTLNLVKKKVAEKVGDKKTVKGYDPNYGGSGNDSDVEVDPKMRKGIL